MKDTDIMYFGKYEGKTLEEVPASYLLWVADETDEWSHIELKKYILEKRKQLEQEVEQDREDEKDALQGYPYW